MARQRRFCTTTPSCWAMRSMAMNPALCGVHRYSETGIAEPHNQERARPAQLPISASLPPRLTSSLRPRASCPPQPRRSSLPFLATSGSAGVPAAPGAAAAPAARTSTTSGVATTSSRIETTWATVASSGVQVLDLVGVGQTADAHHLVHSQFAHIHIDVAGNVRRQALDFHFAQHLVQDAALGLDADRNAQQLDAHA